MRDYLRELFVDEILDTRQVPISIFCNKQDDPDKLTKDKIRQVLEVNELAKRPGIKYLLSSGSGNESTGITDSLDWLYKHLKRKRVRMETME